MGRPTPLVLAMDSASSRAEAARLDLKIGTPSYMAPEQVRGEDVDARTDIYSAGVLLFELLTGQKPFHSERAAAVMLQHQETPPPTLGSVLPGAGFSPQLEAAISKALAKKPEDRFSSATDFAAALEALPELSTTPAPIPTLPAVATPAISQTGAQARSKDFLVREVGAPSAPFLEVASRTHAYANVRSRAARLLPKVTAPR